MSHVGPHDPHDPQDAAERGDSGAATGPAGANPVDGRCFHCNAPTCHRFGERWVCEDCYAARASCCAEFEGDQET